MPEGLEKLTAEADRIVNSPYPTQLKHLRDILCTDCTEADVSQWVLSKPCQIDRLSSCVLNGLPQWPYVLDIVTKLSHDPKVRDAFLRLEPLLLHDLIAQAAKEQDVHSKYTTAATTMLFHPLPSHLGLPCDTQDLFLRLVDFAAREPSNSTIKPIYQILKGTSSLLVDILSSATLRHFEEELCTILKNLKGDNHTLSLYCLAIMKTMSVASSSDRACSTVASYDTQELLDSSSLSSGVAKWTPEIVQQFFSESKAQKTTQLVVLRAMWACTISTGEPAAQRLETLVLANELIGAVPVDSREVWRKANAMIARKLEEKALTQGSDTRLRFQALCFLTKLTEGCVIPAMVIDGLRDIVTVPDMLTNVLADTSASEIAYLIRIGVFDQVSTTALLQNLVDATTSASAQQWVRGSALIAQLLEQLSSKMSMDNKISEGVMLALDVLACGQKLERLRILIKPMHGNTQVGEDSGMCPSALHQLRKQLVHQLCKIFLQASLSSSHQNFAVSPDTLSLLLILHGDSAGPPQPCSHSINIAPSRHHSPLLAEPGSLVRDAGSDWRQTLEHHLQARAQEEQKTLKVLFGEACADLESRCGDVERPLREERDKRVALETRYGELQEAYEALEAQAIDRSIQLDEYKGDRDRLVSELETLQSELGASEQNLQNSEHRLERARLEQEKARHEADDRVNLVELKHAAAFAKKEEELDDANERLSTASGNLQSLSRRLEEQETKYREVTEEMNKLRQDRDVLRRTSSEQGTAIQELTNERNCAVRAQERLEDDLHATRNAMEAAEENHAKKADLSNRQAEQRLHEAITDHEHRLEEISNRHAGLITRLEQELSNTRAEASRAHEEQRAEISQHESEIAEKRKKIDRLQRKCEDKEKQIAEANAMRSNLMAAIGIGGAPQEQQSKLNHRNRRARTTQTQQVHSQDPSPPTPRSGDDDMGTQRSELDEDMSLVSHASETESRSGPTPKRPRQRMPMVNPSPPQPRPSMKPSTRSAVKPGQQLRSAVKPRSPLQNVTANRQHPHRKSFAPVSFKTPVNDAQMLLDDASFNGSGLFAGTPGPGRRGSVDCLDEETQTGL